MSETRHRVPGSERQLPADVQPLGPSDPVEHGEVTVVLRRRGGTPAPRARGARPTRDQLAADTGADPADIEAVAGFAAGHGLAVVRTDPPSRQVVLGGTLGELSAAFEVALGRYRGPQGEFRGRSGAITVPGVLGGMVEAVLGLDDRPQMHPHFRRAADAGAVAARALEASVSFTAVEVAQLYDFPADHDGSGECIAILEFDGGYRADDLATYFKGLGMAPPAIEDVSVDGGRNRPGGEWDTEVELDIEIAGAVAPGARLCVYFAPNTDRGFVDCLAAAVHDAERAPSVISISWGGAESSWSAQGVRVLDGLLEDAATLGVTVCVASGDDGSSDRVEDGRAHVDFPASSPWSLACGGTTLRARDGRILDERAWHQPEGSEMPPPANPGGRRGRGVPDVAGDADTRTGYEVVVDGAATVVGGTSAVAPLMAGLVARCNQALGTPAGFLNPVIYAPGRSSQAFRDITTGNNGAYHAGRGWDACTGLGVPVGSELLAVLRRASAAGKLGR